MFFLAVIILLFTWVSCARWRSAFLRRLWHGPSWRRGRMRGLGDVFSSLELIIDYLDALLFSAAADGLRFNQRRLYSLCFAAPFYPRVNNHETLCCILFRASSFCEQENPFSPQLSFLFFFLLSISVTEWPYKREKIQTSLSPLPPPSGHCGPPGVM